MLKFYQEIKNNPGLLPKIVVMIYRFGNFIVYKVRIPLVKQALYVVYRFLDLIFLKFLLNDDIPAKFKAGSGFKIYHPYGIFINDAVEVGENFICRGQVTLGNKGNLYENGCPQLGNNISVGVGAKIIGELRLEDGCRIGANAVVTKSFKKGSILIGIPARNISKDGDHSL
ncbi:serine acetyltransferase [Lactiplantibacillus pentosus]|uniref:serine acetyltransferase n=1 Tax=Lactiplantibacillus pentosus TaxID=1589 RepID=UPI0021A6FEBD|nr:serine acetyltransferase [Lactiplantibacillus pentosus]MCT3297245.1 serine acetyltransferase [Lactiplantibacillus pentosus]